MGLVPGNIRKMLKTPQTNQKNESFRSFIVFPMQKSPFYRRYTVYGCIRYTSVYPILRPCITGKITGATTQAGLALAEIEPRLAGVANDVAPNGFHLVGRGCHL